ncbi:hypothetical protein YC2023_106884 [Brassica napus]
MVRMINVLRLENLSLTRLAPRAFSTPQLRIAGSSNIDLKHRSGQGNCDKEIVEQLRSLRVTGLRQEAAPGSDLLLYTVIFLRQQLELLLIMLAFILLLLKFGYGFNAPSFIISFAAASSSMAPLALLFSCRISSLSGSSHSSPSLTSSSIEDQRLTFFFWFIAFKFAAA